ncbi:MAG: phosphate acetyltransferase [Proteobacteria bacterium]|uniref:Phosphate acetyltransferase n=1 Tax=Candidatus Avisuccinivibrio stercorigallinarum TaxID=2840704 RepID=A0A9D9DC99_9GAMM|nr:phosphate acetyltransferase [Candidatus Avisuccinivibrio stercorigallinarum]
MSRNLILVPSGRSTGLYVASLGCVASLNANCLKAVLFRPLDCCSNVCGEDCLSIGLCDAAKLISQDKRSELLETIVANYNKLVEKEQPDVVVIEGAVADAFDQDAINAEICHAFDAEILVVDQGACGRAAAMRAITLKAFGNAGKNRVLGDIILNADAPKNAHGVKQLMLAGKGGCCGKKDCGCQGGEKVGAIERVAAKIDYNPELYAARACDIAAFLKTEVKSGDAKRYVSCVTFDAAEAQECCLLITDKVPGETKAGVVILAGGASGAVDGAAVIESALSVWEVAGALADMPARLPADDTEKAEKCAAYAAPRFCSCLSDHFKEKEDRVPLMSPAAFRYKLTELARAAHKRIALPEGDEPRTVCAAAAVARQGIAVPVLFGKKDKILAVAAEKGVTLGEGVEFVDPEEVRENYVARLVELRKKKGLTEEQAREQLKDNVVLGTMMLERGEVDGLVSGAVHTTANTIRPPLQIIKTAPNASLVSSVFFMLMPEQVYVFGDCAINPNPKPEELAEIAIQSADTAKTFGIDPRVAMVTYSTGTSGKGPDIDMVVEAVRIAKEKRPDLNLDGPLQYDASVMPDVAAQKAPNSPVAGKATVFIFPSLATGNTVYKAVQRSANLVSIGPMLQGMRKPVNDLSRGALVDDIIYTIAITAIQATQQ